MVAELVEFRLSRYLAGKSEGWPLKVSHAGGRAMLFLGRARNVGLPEGEESFFADDAEYAGSFVKVAMNVARRPGTQQNVLPDLLRRWFGPLAGRPGTAHTVVLERKGERLVMRPARADAPAEREAG